MSDASAGGTAVRRFAGPLADEISLLCRPAAPTATVEQQSEAAYRSFAALLDTHRSSFRDLSRETLFLKERRLLPRVLAVRARVLADLGQSDWAPAPVSIQQAPLSDGAILELSAAAVVPHDREAWSVEDVRGQPDCACEGCLGSGARLVRLGDQLSLHSTNIFGRGEDSFAQALAMFQQAQRLLEQCGLGFRDVARTWIYLRDIDRDYAALNQARRQFFRDCGIELRPASTGVQGIPIPDAHDFALSLYAVKAPRQIDFASMSTPSLNEAWSYGADFSRGLRVTDANKIAIQVSGTASIDDTGRTVHAGNFTAQLERTLGNVASLLAEQGAGFANILSGIAYLKNPNDAAQLRAMCHRRGFAGFPCALVEAPLCRPDLLCEVEAVAMLPLAVPTA